MKNNILQMVFHNCQGLNSAEIQKLQYNTHFTKNDETAIRNQWGGECIFYSFASNQRGVVILLSNTFEYKIF